MRNARVLVAPFVLAALAAPGTALADHQGPPPPGPPPAGAKFNGSIFDNPSFHFTIGPDAASIVKGKVKFSCKKGRGAVNVPTLAIEPETAETYPYYGVKFTAKPKLKKGRKRTRVKVTVTLDGFFTDSGSAQGALKVAGKGCKVSTERYDSSTWLI